MADTDLIERLKFHGRYASETQAECTERKNAEREEAATALAEKDAQYERLASRMDAMAADNQRLRAECEGLRAALEPFAEGWDVAIHHEDLVRHLTMAQLGELAAHEVSGVHFRNARAALSQKETGA